MSTPPILINKELFERAYLLGVLRERAGRYAFVNNRTFLQALAELSLDQREWNIHPTVIRALRWTEKNEGDPTDWDILTEQA